jgi:hypothetical protein
VDLLSFEAGLWFSAVSSSGAAAFLLWGTRHGVSAHRYARAMVAVAVALIAFSYWADVFDWFRGAQMRRGAGWLLWPALAWREWLRVRYYKRFLVRVEETTAFMNRDD